MERHSPLPFSVNKLAVMCIICIGVFALPNAAWANRVTLIATLNNQSALSPAFWSIFKENEQHKPFVTLPRHSGTIHLPPGKYQATVKSNKSVKKTVFRVESGVSTTVTVALDE